MDGLLTLEKEMSSYAIEPPYIGHGRWEQDVTLLV